MSLSQPEALQQISDELRASRQKAAAAKDAPAPPVKQATATKAPAEAAGKSLKDS